jgi:hypothetical protein
VTDVAVSHEVAVVADLRDAAARAATAVHGYGFPDDAVRADRKLGFRKVVPSNLAFSSKHGLRVNDGAVANMGMSAYYDMRQKSHAYTENGVAPDHAIRTNIDASAENRAVLDYGRRMHGHGQLL